MMVFLISERRTIIISVLGTKRLGTGCWILPSRDVMIANGVKSLCADFLSRNLDCHNFVNSPNLPR